MKQLFWAFEDLIWNLKCIYNFWLHGPYGLSKVLEKMPFRYIIKYLRKYGATVGKDCRFERGINIHRPLGTKPFENLVIANGVYLGHNTLIDLTRKIIIKDKVIIASRCQLWTHSSTYKNMDIDEPSYEELNGEIIIEEGAIVYSGVIITHGCSIGAFSKIGACSLINKSIPDCQFWGGVPVKRIIVNSSFGVKNEIM